jgi:hypothetical protein
MTAARDRWPFGDDADREDPLTARRIAVTGRNPRWAYLVAFDGGSEARPTDAEAAMIESFLEEYKAYWYGTEGGYRVKLAERDLDVDGGANGVLFHKYADGDWAYRRRTWTMGPWFVPPSPMFRSSYPNETHGGPLTLDQLLDRVSGSGDAPSQRWIDWKAAHPDVFAAD